MAKERVAFKIGNLGDNLRLQCPIVGYPAPFFEWKKVTEESLLMGIFTCGSRSMN